jgi:hypothetical protein
MWLKAERLVWAARGGRYGGAATALLAASAGGLLGAHVLAGDVRPAWAEAPPLCITDGVRLLAVRSEARAL